jgi:hypothetical protein
MILAVRACLARSGITSRTRQAHKTTEPWAAPSLNFPICLQGNGDGATQYQRTVSMAAQRQTGFADARECTPQDAIAEYRSPRASCDGLEVMTQHNLSTTVAPGGAPVRLRCMRQGDHFRY